MLRRAIASVLAQTHTNFVVYVVNDAPDDDAPNRIITEFNDPRVSLFEPVTKRGATKNFNLVYEEAEADFSALLEDDNWWEPEFLRSQLEVLREFPEAPAVVGNETIWREAPDGSWECTNRTIWPFRDTRLHKFSLTDLCGHAKICNSSMLIRTRRNILLLTPNSIPVDVTEHFRERLLPSVVPLNGVPLVNYAETLATARGKGAAWSQYQISLIGSVFLSLDSPKARSRLAKELWRQVPSEFSPRAGCLIDVGIGIPAARSLLRHAPVLSLIKAFAGILKAPARLAKITQTRRDLAAQIEFLVSAPLTQELSREYECENPAF